MIARVDSNGFLPLDVARKFAGECFGGKRQVDTRTFYGMYSWYGFSGTFKLEDGDREYGIRWFKRRGRVFAIYLRDTKIIRSGAHQAMAEGPLVVAGGSESEQVSFLDGYLSGIRRKMKADARRALETDIYTRIESLLYDGV